MGVVDRVPDAYSSASNIRAHGCHVLWYLYIFTTSIEAMSVRAGALDAACGGVVQPSKHTTATAAAWLQAPMLLRSHGLGK